MLFEYPPQKNTNPVFLIKQEIGAKHAIAAEDQHFAVSSTIS